MRVQVLGYSWYASGFSEYLAITVVVMYMLIALVHTIWVLSTGVTSSSWDTVTELLALALQSPVSKALKGSGAGIERLGTYQRILKLRVREEGQEEKVILLVDEDGNDTNIQSKMSSFAIATRLVIYMEQKIPRPNKQFPWVWRPSGLPYRTMSFLLASLATHVSTTPTHKTTAPSLRASKFPSVSEIGSWLRRGVRFRTGNAETPFRDLSELRAAVYNEAVGDASPSPYRRRVIGRTNHHYLASVIPHGNGNAISISFKGASLSARVEDNQNDFNLDKTTLGRVVSLSAGSDKGVKPNEGETRAKIDHLVEKTEAHTRHNYKQRLPRGHLIYGMCVMGLLCMGAPAAAMPIDEQDGIFPWCESKK
ncbi:MAG: hypothetical protein Q9204_007384 [Flavoplaca sp. TL-2023a]